MCRRNECRTIAIAGRRKRGRRRASSSRSAVMRCVRMAFGAIGVGLLALLDHRNREAAAVASRRQLTPWRNPPCSSLPPARHDKRESSWQGLLPLAPSVAFPLFYLSKGWKGWMRRRRHSGDRVAARVPHATACDSESRFIGACGQPDRYSSRIGSSHYGDGRRIHPSSPR